MIQEAGLDWPPSFEDIPSEFKIQLQSLARRPAECAYYHDLVTQPQLCCEAKQPVDTIIDLNMSLGWQIKNVTKGLCGCMVSSAQLWAVHRQRLLMGDEYLALRGMVTDLRNDNDFDTIQNKVNRVAFFL